MDFNIESRSLLLRRNSHRIHRIHRSLLLKRKLPRNSRNTQKFIAEKKLPQISRIYTDASKLFCEFREFFGSKYLCKSVKSVGEYPLPVCSVCSVKSVGASLRLRGRSLLLKRKLPQNSRNSQKFIVEKKLPQISRIYTDVSKIFCVFREFCGSKYLLSMLKSKCFDHYFHFKLRFYIQG